MAGAIPDADTDPDAHTRLHSYANAYKLAVMHPGQLFGRPISQPIASSAFPHTDSG